MGKQNDLLFVACPYSLKEVLQSSVVLNIEYQSLHRQLSPRIRKERVENLQRSSAHAADSYPK